MYRNGQVGWRGGAGAHRNRDGRKERGCQRGGFCFYLFTWLSSGSEGTSLTFRRGSEVSHFLFGVCLDSKSRCHNSLGDLLSRFRPILLGTCGEQAWFRVSLISELDDCRAQYGSLGVQVLKYKVSTQNHNYDSEHRDPRQPMLGYLGPIKES